MFATGDLGSNSFRLTISKNIDGQYQVIDSLKEMIHFAAGLDKNRFLDKSAEERALDCLKKFGERLRGFKESQVRIVATNTFRIAKNIDDFLPKAEKAIGFPIEVIGGREESRLIYTGVLHTEDFHGRKVLIVDIGGGSTEFSIGENENPEITESLNMGCVSFSKEFFDQNNITGKQFKKAINAARVKLQSIRQEITASGWQIAVGSSGTAKTLHALKNAEKPGATSFNYDFLVSLKDLILEEGSVEKAKLKEIKANRTEVFAGGLAVMIAVFEELGIREMRTTEAGLRDGVLFEFSGRSLDKDLRENTVESFANRYQVNKAQATAVSGVALTFFTLLQESHFVASDPLYARRIIRWAAALHEIGLFISHTAYHKHSAYILANADMPGFSRNDQMKLDLIVLAHRGSLKKILTELAISPLFSGITWYAIIALRLAATFCRARNGDTLPLNTTLSYDEKSKTLLLKLEGAWLKNNPLTESALESEIAHWQATPYHLKIDRI